MTPLLFTPLRLRDLTVRNRMWLSPMCQYSVEARDGVPTDWHLVHLGGRAAGGFGLVMTEGTAVTPEGRISPQDTGLWDDAQAEGWARVVAFVHGQGAAAGIQLAHAGRKASTFAMALRRDGTISAADGGWTPVAPSPVAYPGLDAPHELTRTEIAEIVAAFGAAAARADRAGFDLVELHGGHGYLIHQFLSPLSNLRTDGYGGSFENRTRFLREVVAAVRESWPPGKPLSVRFSGSEWAAGAGWTLAETGELARELGPLGVDLVDVSSGGVLAPREPVTVGPGYQVGFAQEVRTRSGLPTGAVGMITEPTQAEQVLADGAADVVLFGRVALREPAWPLRAAAELGVPRDSAPYPTQYRKGAWPRNEN